MCAINIGIDSEGVGQKQPSAKRWEQDQLPKTESSERAKEPDNTWFERALFCFAPSELIEMWMALHPRRCAPGWLYLSTSRLLFYTALRRFGKSIYIILQLQNMNRALFVKNFRSLFAVFNPRSPA
jgi:hypothetical protein